MKNLIVVPVLAAAGAAVLAGCSASGAASTGFNVFRNTQSNRLGVRLYLDGHEAKRNEAEQAARGYSKWKVREPVSAAPKLRFEFKDPAALGRIRTITLALYQEFKSGYADSAEYVVTSRTDDPAAQMQPGTEYDLGAPGEGFRVLDFHGRDVPGVKLKPGFKYMLVFSVAAEDSETAQVYFSVE